MTYCNLSDARRYAGSMEQLADARLVELAEGPGRGSRLIEFRNGSGLAFTVAPDRGMDLVDCSFRGIPLVFRAPAGYVSGERYEPQGTGWLRSWQGGLMTTSGLRNAGVPDGEHGLHGRASHLAAEDVGIRRGASGGSYRLEAVGTLRESAMFGEYLQLERSVSTGFGDNSITLCDTITNLAPREDYLELLYHCNFGYPFASPDLEFEAPPHEVVPRDAEAAAGLAGPIVGIDPSESELVIALALVRVGKNIVGLIDLLELFLGVLIAGVIVRVVLHCKLAVCLFDLGIGRSLGYPQHFVVITLFLCHIHSPLRERLIRETPRLVPRSITSKSRSGKTGAAFAIPRVRPPVWPGTHCCVFYQTSLKSASTTPSSPGFCWLFAPASGPGCAPAACCAAAAA